MRNRHSLLGALLLGGGVLLWTALPAFAQRGGGGGGRGGGGSGGHPSGGGGGGHPSSAHYSGHPGAGGSYGNGHAAHPYYRSSYYPYYRPYVGIYAGLGYYSGSGYYGGSGYVGGYDIAPASYYYSPGYPPAYGSPPYGNDEGFVPPMPAPLDDQPIARIRVRVPDPNAVVLFDGQKTQQSGRERSFATPPLEKGTYSYQIRATWNQGGQPVTQERTVNVSPGTAIVVDFNEERLQPPQKK